MTQKNNQRGQSSDLKTFPVPIKLTNPYQNIKTTNYYSKELSKQELINNAINLHLEGNILQAEKAYKYFIDQDFSDPIIFSNYGIILKDQGKLFEAELFLRKAINIKPDYDEACYNLGIILLDSGKLKEAELFTRRATEINSNFGKAFSNLSIILQKLSLLEEAEIMSHKAIQIEPNVANYYLVLGSILLDKNRLKEAELATRKAIKLNPRIVKAYANLGEILFRRGKTEESYITEWNGIKLEPEYTYLINYRKNAKLINKTAFYIFSYTIFNHYKSIIKIDPSVFEILVPDNFDKEIISKIRTDFGERELRLRYHSELIENNNIYKKLVSNQVWHTKNMIYNDRAIKTEISLPNIKLFGKANINFMYTAGKNKSVFSYWNKHYDGVLCFGPYHENRMRVKHKISTAQMGYPRFDKYFKPGYHKNDLIKKFNCDPNKKTIVWLTTWTELSSVEKYYKEVSLLKKDHNIVVRPHPAMRVDDPESYNKLYTTEFNYIDDNQDDNVQLYALADLMLFDYGGSMFGSLYLNKNFAFLDMNTKAKNHYHLGVESSEDYFKSFFPERIATLENLNSVCNFCLNNPPSIDITNSLREEFFNMDYQGNSAQRAFDLLTSKDWLK